VTLRFALIICIEGDEYFYCFYGQQIVVNTSIIIICLISATSFCAIWCCSYFLLICFALQVGQLREVSNKVHNAELKLFLEVELGLVIFVFMEVVFHFDCMNMNIQILSFWQTASIFRIYVLLHHLTRQRMIYYFSSSYMILRKRSYGTE